MKIYHAPLSKKSNCCNYTITLVRIESDSFFSSTPVCINCGKIPQPTVQDIEELQKILFKK